MKKIIFLGDSTMQYNDQTTFPQVGWPQGFYKYLNDKIEVCNFAKNGRSTKSFIDEGRFQEALETVDEESIVLIEFGHNDEHTHQPERFTRPFVEYKDNLTFMVEKVREKGGYVILLSPIYRRLYLEDGSVDPSCHAEYRDAVKMVAKELEVPFVDMCTLTQNWLSSISEQESREYYMNFDAGIYPNYIDGSKDNTHLRQKGADLIASIFKEESIKLQLPICQYYL